MSTQHLSTQHFEATVVKSGAKLRIVLPFDPHVIWGMKARHAVTGSINGSPVRGSLAAEGDQFILPLGAAWCRDCGLADGATVAVTLAPEGPQAANLAPDIAAALDAAPQAKAFFESLATFYRKGYIRWIEGAKRPETRSARIAEMVRLLQAGQKQR
jgi:hypothetical protein